MVSSSMFRTSIASPLRDVATSSTILESPLSRLGIGTAIDPGLFLPPHLTPPSPVEPPSSPPPGQPVVSPGDANIFLGRTGTQQDAILTLLAGARAVFEAIPVAQTGDVISADIPNGFRNALISLVNLIDAAMRRFPTPPQPMPLPTPSPMPTPTPVPPGGGIPSPIPSPFPFPLPGPIPSPIPSPSPVPIPFPGPILTHPDFPGTVFVPTAPTAQPSGPAIDPSGLGLAASALTPITATHPETGETATVMLPANAALEPLSGGGFRLSLGGVSGAGTTVGGLGGGLIPGIGGG